MNGGRALLRLDALSRGSRRALPRLDAFGL